jgi:hypothetical protein
MNVREMIAALQKVENQELPVVYCDYISGNMMVSSINQEMVSTFDDKEVLAVFIGAEESI